MPVHPPKRVLDVAVASGLLVLLSPLLLIAAVGIKLTSPGPILYKARRIGRDRRREPATAGAGGHAPASDGRRDTAASSSRCTNSGRCGWPSSRAPRSPRGPIARVFPFGAFLRATKIDELPQLINVIRGDMALVGPRPEAPEIVRSHYTADDILTLQVAPGVTSPGSLYYYTHCEPMLLRR